MKFLDPKSDIVFKKIFCEHKELLIHFLNAILPLEAHRTIVSLEYLPHEQAPEIPGLKRPVVDVKCYDTQGRIFIVEMQFEWNDAFISRMTFNTSKAYVNQLPSGKDGSYNQLHPVYGIAVLSEHCQKRSDWGDGWYHPFMLTHQENPQHTIQDMHLIFLELSKFTPTSHGERRLAVLWMRFLREIQHLDAIPEEFEQVPEIKRACAIANQSTYTAAELYGYDRFWDSVRRENTLIFGAKKEGLEEGIEMGKAEGKAEGLAEGLQEGIAMGAIAEKRAIARKLQILGLDDSAIAAATGLTQEDVEGLK